MSEKQRSEMEEDARSFLEKFVEEFPAPLEEGNPMPVSPLSQRVSLEELPGESLELGLRLLAARGAPPGLCALLCHAALGQLLKSDLSPFHCPQAEAAQEEEEEEEENTPLLRSEPVQRLFLNLLMDVASAWHREPPGPPPPAAGPPHCSVHAIRNTRRKMEDRHLALGHFNQLFGLQDGVERAYYGVFDGHGGVDAAVYCATHLHVALSKQDALQSDPSEAFKAAFTHTDRMFRAKAKRERLRSGSTGVAVLIQGPELTVAWLGDSQALLVRRGQVVTLMSPHKPEREDEKQRIEDLGGCVTFMGCWRVNGTYAVSRAIGDFDQKPYVSSDADCGSVQLRGGEDYVLLACDGFFDAVSPSEVPGLVQDALRQTLDPEGEGGAAADHWDGAVGQRVAERLVGHAKTAGSSDNITVMLVFLGPPQQLLTPLPAPEAGPAPQESFF